MNRLKNTVSLIILVAILLTGTLAAFADTSVTVNVPDRIAVTITVKDAAKFQDLDDPEFKYSVSGADAAKITDIVVEREPGEEPGEYKMTAHATGFNTEYKYKFVDGTFTIKKMPAVLKAIKKVKDFLTDIPLYLDFYDQVIKPIKEIFKDKELVARVVGVIKDVFSDKEPASNLLSAIKAILGEEGITANILDFIRDIF